MSISNDWHSAHPETDKFTRVEQQTIKYEPCAGCGTLMRPITAALAQKLYAANTDIDPEKIRHLCPKCRQLEDARRTVCALPRPAEAKPAVEEGPGASAPTNE